MVIQTFTLNDFKKMPWKNGGGVTTEIYSLNDSLNSSLLFRLSMATVERDGPFSIFPGIDRILLLLKGEGFHLKNDTFDTLITMSTSPVNFKGEESIKCILINGPCVDFNVMTARNYAHSNVFIKNISEKTSIIFKAECDFKFIYDNEVQRLYKLDSGDEMTIKGEKKRLIVIDVKKI